MRRTVAFLAGAIASLGIGAVLFLLAVDVSRWNDALREDDVRYRAVPRASSLWQPETVLPRNAARGLLAIGDDVEFREAVRAVRLSRLEEGLTSDPEVVLQRGEAQARLQAIAGGHGDPLRRSRAMNLLAVLSFATALSETRDQAAHLQDAATGFQAAIALDPDNDEAKANLELVLQRGRALQPTEGSGGPNPSPGGSGAKGAGAGDPGSGY
jgi:hypothetical protein